MAGERLSVGDKRRHHWTRQAAAWLVALALSIGTLFPLPGIPSAAASADPFVAADICASEHGGAEAGEGKAAAGHDCRQHCCLISAHSLPPVQVSVLPARRTVAIDLPQGASPAPGTRPDPVHPARAPPILAA
jgi:hypothetical protein